MLNSLDIITQGQSKIASVDYVCRRIFPTFPPEGNASSRIAATRILNTFKGIQNPTKKMFSKQDIEESKGAAMADAFMAFWGESRYTLQLADSILISKGNEFFHAGAVDLVAKSPEGQSILFEFVTQIAIDQIHFARLAAMQRLWQANHIQPVTDRILVRFPVGTETNLEIRHVKDVTLHQMAFERMLGVIDALIQIPNIKIP